VDAVAKTANVRRNVNVAMIALATDNLLSKIKNSRIFKNPAIFSINFNP